MAEAAQDVMPVLEGIVTGLADSNGNLDWGNWDKDERTKFLQDHGVSFDESRYSNPGDLAKAQDEDLYGLIEDSLPDNVIRATVESHLEAGGDGVNTGSLDLVFPRQVVDADYFQTVFEGVQRGIQIETESVANSVVANNKPFLWTTHGAPDHAANVAANGLDAYELAEEKRVGGIVGDAIDLLPYEKQAQARILVNEIHAGNDGRVDELRNLIESAPVSVGDQVHMENAARVLRNVSGGDDLTWDRHDDAALDRTLDRHGDVWDVTNPVISNVTTVYQEGTTILTVNYGVSRRGTPYGDTRTALEIEQGRQDALTAQVRYNNNQQTYADLKAKPNKTADDLATMRDLEAWAEREGAVLNWVPSSEFQPFDPAVPPEQLNQSQDLEDLNEEWLQKHRDEHEDYEFGHSTGIRDVTDAVRGDMYPEGPGEITDTSSQDLWNLTRDIPGVVEKIAKVDPDTARLIARGWRSDPKGTLELVETIEKTHGITVMSDETRGALELQGFIPMQFQPRPSEHAQAHSDAEWQKIAIWNGKETQGAINTGLEEHSQLLLDLSCGMGNGRAGTPDCVRGGRDGRYRAWQSRHDQQGTERAVVHRTRQQCRCNKPCGPAEHAGP